MASPQKENGYTPIANEIMEIICSTYMPSTELRCLLYLLRRTYGFQKKEDKISYSQFANGTGISVRAARKAIQNLIDSKILAMRKGAQRETITYWFNKNYQDWLPMRKGAQSISYAQGCAKAMRKGAQSPMRKGAQHKRKKENLKKEGEFKVNSFIPENYQITDQHTAYAESKGFTGESITEMFERFATHHRAKGSKFKSWYAAWQKWVQNQIKFHGDPKKPNKSLAARAF